MGSLYAVSLAKQIDKDIEQRLSNGVWEMPAQVYSKSWVLSQGDPLSRDSLVRILKSTRYQESASPDAPGEFSLSRDGIVIYRREFSYPDHAAAPARYRVTFRNGKIAAIIAESDASAQNTLEIEPRLVSMMYSAGDEQRIFRPLASYPESLISMLIATEDRSFWQHHGINLTAIARAFFNNLRAGRTVEGGSTVTQQVVKNLFLSRDKTYSRKIREILMALILERKFSKDRILELYLNEVYLGQDGARGIYGFPLASTYYFGRQVNELTLAQQAMLIGMAKGASLYNPWTRPGNALARRNVVLGAARAADTIDEKAYQLALKSELRVQQKGSVFIQHPAFMSLLKKEIRDSKGLDMNALSGSRIFSTFDPVAQDDAEKTVTETVPRLAKKSGNKDLQAALVVIESRSGNISAIVGDRNVGYNGFNRATDSNRQIGSLVKPFVYLSALQTPELYGLNTWLEDEPVKIETGKGQYWSPRNSNRTYSGRVMLVDALAHSVNVATVNLGMAIGTDTVARILKETGIPEKKISRAPSMLLGSLDMAPVELAAGYQTIANGGRYTGVSTLLSIQNRKGEVIYQRLRTSGQVVPAEASWLTLYAMQQSVKAGTSRKFGYGLNQYSLAGKTGTSSNNRDSWFTGIDGDKVVLAWAGRDNNQPTRLWGASGSLLLTRAFFDRNGLTPLRPMHPDDIYNVNVGAEGNVECNYSRAQGNGEPVLSRMLPVWGKSRSAICSEGQQFRPVSAEKPYSQGNIDTLF
nr:penicillin-binding protein 1B [Pantoea agglomerans]